MPITSHVKLFPSPLCVPLLCSSEGQRQAYEEGTTQWHIHIRASHPSPDPHLSNNGFVLNNDSPALEHIFERLHNTFETRLRAYLLREACDSQVGAAAAVQEGVEFGGEGERGDVKGYSVC